MNQSRSNDEWVRAKRVCRLSDDEIRMARELGIGPRALTKNIPNPKERWKAPVGVWIRGLYAKRINKSPQVKFGKPQAVASAGARLPTVEFEAAFAGSNHPTDQEITEENGRMQRRQGDFRLAAEYVAAAFAHFEPVKKIVLFGSVASPLKKEIPRFRKFRNAGQAILHECKDVDFAVWLADLTILKSLQRARGEALNDLFADREIGVAHHQVDVFLIAPETGEYLGRLCNFGECPKGKPECFVRDCGTVKFLRQFEAFVFRSDALSPDRIITLFERGTCTAGSALDEMGQIPF